MMEKEKHKGWQELIEGFHNGTLSEIQLEEYKILEKTDEAFKESSQSHREFLAVIDEQNELKTKAFLQELEQEIVEQEAKIQRDKAKIVRMNRILALVGCLALLVLGTWYFLPQPKSNLAESQAIFKENFEPYRNLLNPITRSETNLTPIELAFESYEKANFPKAISQFETILKDTVWQDASFYLGVSYLANNQAEEAIKTFKQIPDSETQFALEKTWYLSLAYLKVGNRELARKELESLEKYFPGSNWNMKAEKLLEELEE